jgi:hypothetical protein
VEDHKIGEREGGEKGEGRGTVGENVKVCTREEKRE